jgi:hypothetical protein
VNVEVVTVVGSRAREKTAETVVSFGAPSPGAVEVTVGGVVLWAVVVKLQDAGAARGTPSTAVIVDASLAV